MVSAHLQHAGFDTLLAKDGDEAIKKAKESQPDLILMDIRMGGTSGSDAALELKKFPETKGIKIAFLSGLDNPWPAMSGDKSDISKEMGMEDFIAKTDDMEIVIAKVKKMLKVK
jgi:CheY-like chemotaxis protein